MTNDLKSVRERYVDAMCALLKARAMAPNGELSQDEESHHLEAFSDAEGDLWYRLADEEIAAIENTFAAKESPVQGHIRRQRDEVREKADTLMSVCKIWERTVDTQTQLRESAENTMQAVAREHDEIEATCAVLREALVRAKRDIESGPTPFYKTDWIDAVLAVDAGKLAAEVLRAADEWERAETALIAEHKATSEDCDTSCVCELSDALGVAVRARRGDK